MGVPRPARYVRFGPFQLDLRAAELSRHGIKVRVPDQSIKVLAKLIEHSGDVVTREELHQRLWPNGTIVEFDRSINAAVQRLRQALGDSASTPRYIETLPRLGYRFAVPVEQVPAQDPTPLYVEAEASPPNDAFNNMNDVKIEHPELNEEFKSRPLPIAGVRRIIKVSGITVGVLSISALGLLWWSRPLPMIQHRWALKQLTRDGGLTTDPVLSRDGRFLAYASDRGGDGNLDIWVQLVTGGEAVRLTRDGADEREPNFSPDGSQIAFRSEREGGGIYVVSTLGGEPRLIAKRGHGPRFSPQGDSIAYWLGQTNEGDPTGSGTGELRIVPSAGGPSKQLCADFSSAVRPVWSPDGKHILFKGARNKQPGVKDGAVVDWWVTTPDGNGVVRTGIQRALSEVQSSISTREYETTTFFQIVPSDWVGDHIVFSARVGDSTNLWQVKLSPTGEIHGVPQRVTFGAGIEMAPSVDRAGHVVFANMSHKATMWSLPIRSNTGSVLGPPTRLTSGAGPDILPSISEDGKRLAYTTIRTGKNQLITKDLESGRERILTEQGNGRSLISRDGLRLAYAVHNGEQIGLYVMNTMGGDAEKVCDDCARNWDWSPDGKKVAYIAGDHPPCLGVYDVESHRSTYMLPDSEYQIYEPRFSPDGRWLAFNARLGPDRTQGFAIDVLRASAVRKSDWVPLNEGRFWNEQPEWTPSGHFVYFESNRDGFLCIWAQRLDGTTKRVVGAPFAVYHSHSASLVLENFSSPALDKMILSLEENTSNIWIADLERLN